MRCLQIQYLPSKNNPTCSKWTHLQKLYNKWKRQQITCSKFKHRQMLCNRWTLLNSSYQDQWRICNRWMYQLSTLNRQWLQLRQQRLNQPKLIKLMYRLYLWNQCLLKCNSKQSINRERFKIIKLIQTQSTLMQPFSNQLQTRMTKLIIRLNSLNNQLFQRQKMQIKYQPCLNLLKIKTLHKFNRLT